ncbi:MULTISPECIES: long-chain-fatty-acid--CoA ligase [Paenibacillus]|uniref:AMP-binding protein n=1 Tax=Paenibacillus campinasensis TaxID=66347 RepID=A0A268EDP5_9BACL|nr:MULTISPECIES: long-chain fatty acid--CoA ligase [Paenibacillus]MUG67278.1 AMP-binding protein [Paenibacillus campinasensis]PAD71241.1 long-chain fatty acid--CoA ligase [Paenibacillus campinasensis]PAK49070.1 long-chain fatty acid--CoA ligase [Paenibacillus sp. 7541]
MDAKPWLPFYPPEVAPSYEYPKHNLGLFLVTSAQKYPNRPAVYFMGKTLTYKQLLEASYRMANALRGKGINKGDRVAIMLPNCPQVVISYFGALLSGAVVVMTNPLYMEREIAHQMQDSGAKAIITLDHFVARVEKVQGETELKHIIVTSIADYLPFPKNLLFPIKAKKQGPLPVIHYREGVYPFKKLLEQALDAPVCESVHAEKDLALLQYTGGTTGVPKGVMLTHYNLIANTLQSSMWCYKVEEGKERYLAALPCFHVFGLTVLLNQAVYRASELLMVPRFEPKMILDLIRKKKATLFPGAPTMYIALINHPQIKDYDLSSINACISGSAGLPVEVQDTFEELTKGRLIEGYGLTEAAPVTHANPIWGHRKIGTIGIPLPDTEAKVVNPDTGDEVPVGEPGELIVKGPQVMKGYWKRPEDTFDTLRGGWLFTGDMATMDEEGYFRIIDRKKDMIIASGYNIYPREIEEVLYEHPSVKEAVVVGTKDEYRGETVKAYIVLKDGAAPDPAGLEKFCRKQLAAYKVPREFVFRDSLPKTLVGKVLRRKLLEEEEEGKPTA